MRSSQPRRTGRAALVVLAACLAAPLLAGTVATAATPPAGGDCERRVWVPGAERQQVSCLADLTTAGTVASGHTDPADYAGLAAAGTRNPSGVPGVQVDGYFPDDSTTNTLNGWNHDSQFVLRLPDQWNGGLVVAPPPGNRRQYSSDQIIADWVLARGYAYASTDKGNTGPEFYQDGRRPGDAVVEWNDRVTQLTVAARIATTLHYRSPVRRTYATGISNGGYLVRWQLENRPWLYDGGIDWEGTLLRADGPNLFTYLPTALQEYPRYRAGDAAAGQRMLDAGFAPGSEFLWEFHYQVYWDATQRWYRAEFDPGFDGDLEAGIPYCATGTPACDTDYDYFDRPQQVRDAVRRVELTGRIGKPMITLHGTLDTLLPPATDSDVYTDLIADRGRGEQHRYYVVDQGTHVDSLHDVYPDRVRPMLPCMRDAFTALEAWTATRPADRVPPPPSGLVPRGTGDVANSCALPR